MARCPACFVPMTRVEEDGLRMATCAQCFGTWMTGPALLRRMRKDVEEKVDVLGGGTLEDLVEVAAETDTKAVVRCPECGKGMVKGKVHPLIPVTVDQCGACRGYWMDSGELRLVRYLYQQMVTSEDATIRRKLEKIGMVGMQEEEWRRERAKARDELSTGTDGWDLGDMLWNRFDL